MDLRFLFRPAPHPIPAPILLHYKNVADERYREGGLQGVYDWLHACCMDMQTATLQDQASQMSKGRWSGNLWTRLLKRTLLLQYWPQKGNDRPGAETKVPSSWIEVGPERPKGSNPSKLGIRWMRENVKVTDVQVPIDLAQLSTDTLMKTVIAMHTNYILANIQEKLASITDARTPDDIKLEAHPSDSSESYLEFQLTPSQKCRLLIEPITGRFALKPPSALTMQAETTMNSSPQTAHELLLRLRFAASQDEVAEAAKGMGWDVLRTLNIKRDDLKRHLLINMRYILHMRRKGWSKNWVVTFVQNEQQSSWWILEMYVFNETLRALC